MKDGLSSGLLEHDVYPNRAEKGYVAIPMNARGGKDVVRLTQFYRFHIEKHNQISRSLGLTFITVVVSSLVFYIDRLIGEYKLLR